MGVLQSHVHEVWALTLGTRLETRPRYTPTTCFETFAFPWPLGNEPEDDVLSPRIAEAASELNKLRNGWLEPDEWLELHKTMFPARPGGPWAKQIVAEAPATAAYIQRLAKDEQSVKKLKKRTLTNLYNENPRWLQLGNEKLDAAVIEAYAQATGDDGWKLDMSDDEILHQLLRLNAERAS